MSLLGRTQGQGTSNWGAAESAQRVRLVQRVLSGVAQGDADAVFLIVPGVDGHYNANSQRMLKYLLLGASGESLLEPTVNMEDEELEDSVIALYRDQVKIYYSIKAISRIAPIVALWPNIEEFHLLPGEDLGDAAREERFKIQSMVRMLRGRETVILPTCSARTENHEEWPLIQAYGLDEFSTGGFLSAVHKIIHSGSALQSLWSHVDPWSLHLAYSVQQRLLSHWTTSTRLVSKQIRDTASVKFKDAFEPLVGYYDFGSIRCPSSCNKSKFAQGSCVQELTGFDSGYIVRGQDPETAIRFARTYFVDVPEDETGLQQIESYHVLAATLQELLRRIHERISQDSFSFVMDPSRPRALRRLQAIAEEVFAGLTLKLHPHLPQSLAKSLQVNLLSFDLAGQDVDAVMIDGTREALRLIHYLEVTLPLTLGTATSRLVIGDTFVISGSEQDSHALIFTDQISPFLSWDTSRQNEEEIALQMDNLGAPLKGRRRTPCELVFGNSDVQLSSLMLQGHLQFFEFGFVFDHTAFGCMIVDLRDVPRRLTQWVQTPTGCTMVAVENLDEEGKQELPMINPALGAFYTRIVTHIGLLVYEQSELLDALHAWQSRIDGLSFEMEDLTQSSAQVISAFQESHMSQMLWNVVRTSKVTRQSSSDGPSERDGEVKIQSITTQGRKCELLPNASEHTLPSIYIVTGPPGGGKEAIAHTIATKLEGVLIESDPFLFGNGFEVERFHKMICKAGSSNSLVIVTPGDFGPCAVLEAFYDRTPRSISVIAAVSAHHSFRDSRNTSFLPGVQAQVAAGLVHTIILTGLNLVSESISDLVQSRLRLWNPEAELFGVKSLCIPNRTKIALPEAFWFHQEQVHLRHFTKPTKEVPWEHHELDSCVVFASNAVVDRLAFEKLLNVLTRTTRFSDDEDNENEANGSMNVDRGLAFHEKTREIHSVSLSHEGKVISVSGQVSFVEAPEVLWSVGAVGGLCRFEKISEKEGSRKWSMGLLFEGFALSRNTEKIEMLVASTRAQEFNLMTRDDLPPLVLQNVDIELASAPLPPGTWFDGRNYLDAAGRILLHHPYFDRRITEILEQENAQIRTVNLQIAQHARGKISSF